MLIALEYKKYPAYWLLSFSKIYSLQGFTLCYKSKFKDVFYEVNEHWVRELGKRLRENDSFLGGREHHCLGVSCPDGELILPIWKRQDNLEYMEKRCKLPFALEGLLIHSDRRFSIPVTCLQALTRT